MTNPVSEDRDGPLQLSYRTQALYVLTFVLLFLLACGLIGSFIAEPA